MGEFQQVKSRQRKYQLLISWNITTGPTYTYDTKFNTLDEMTNSKIQLIKTNPKKNKKSK
jgi:hypothetical protein